MDRTFESGAAGSPPSAPASPSSGYPTAGNPQAATPATKPGPWWYYQITEELRAVIVAAGLTPDHEDVTQLSQVLAGKQASQPGTVAFFGMSTAPTGWIKANGAAVSRATYAALFAAIGTTFGVGDGATTFNVPDLRGEFIRGWDDGRGVDSGRVFGSAQADDFKSHTHTAAVGNYIQNGTGANSLGADDTTNLTGAAGGTETRPRSIALLACIKY